MPNLLKVWPKLQFVDQNCKSDIRNQYTAVFYLSKWSHGALGRTIPEPAIPFLSIDDANKILEWGRVGLHAEHRKWIKDLKEAINS